MGNCYFKTTECIIIYQFFCYLYLSNFVEPYLPDGLRKLIESKLNWYLHKLPWKSLGSEISYLRQKTKC